MDIKSTKFEKKKKRRKLKRHIKIFTTGKLRKSADVI